MIYKDSLILNFFLDNDDPDERMAFDGLRERLDAKLRSMRLGKLDDYSYDVKGGSFKVDLLGYDAAAMLDLLLPIIKDAAFLIGPKATLIMRGYENNGRPVIKHIDL